jgi:MoaA/NifB/PqqE/SkfB family radical SAM enzyme
MGYTASLIMIKKLIPFSQRYLMRLLRPLVNIDDEIAKISKKPISIGFEVTNICNANCVFCGYQYLKRPKTILSMDLFKKAIDEFNAFGGGGIGFTPIVGEPLLDPNFIEKIKYARNKKNIFRMGFFTNGILINRIGARSIITSGIDEITISIPGFDAQTYSRIFRVNTWDLVYEGMLNLLKENELCDNRVDICIGLRSDTSIYKLLKAPAYKELKRFQFDLQYNIHYDSWSGRIKQENLKGTMRLRNPPKKTEPCSLLYTGPMILSNGDMTLCGCRDLNGDSELVLGNIKDKTILEMWCDSRVDNIRKGFYLSRYPKICQDCSFYNNLSCFRKQKIKTFWIRK